MFVTKVTSDEGEPSGAKRGAGEHEEKRSQASWRLVAKLIRKTVIGPAQGANQIIFYWRKSTTGALTEKCVRRVDEKGYSLNFLRSPPPSVPLRFALSR